MTRISELARLASLDPEVEFMRHKALDKVTAAHLAVDMLNSYGGQGDEAKELVREEKAIALMEDATYYFHKYLRLKLAKYEELLALKSDKQTEIIEKGNKLIRDTIDLAKERGIKDDDLQSS